MPEAVVRSWVGHVDRDVLALSTHIASAPSQEAMRGLSTSSSNKEAGPATDSGQIVNPVQNQYNDTAVKNDPAAN